MDSISRQAAIDVVHKVIIDFFDICDDDEESPMTDKDEQLLEVNKAISTQIRTLPSAQPEPCDVCRYNPPSSMDDKPCTVCPAEPWKEGEAE